MEAWKLELRRNELYHHGIKGQHWGDRNGPPYPLDEATHRAVTKEGLKEERRKRSVRKTFVSGGIMAGGLGAYIGGIALSALTMNPIPMVAGFLSSGAAFVGNVIYDTKQNVRLKELDEQIKAIEEGERMAEAFMNARNANGVGGIYIQSTTPDGKVSTDLVGRIK